MAIAAKPITACKECGGTHLAWQSSVVIRSDVQQGRLNTRDVECLFFLGCDDCSETLATISADTVAGMMNVQEVGYDLERVAKALLPRAIEIAEEQHAGQVDKAGQPYIEHPRRVMRAMRTYAERVVAILHDVIEDGSVTMAQLLAEGFPEAIINALDSVTRRDGESYKDFVARAAADQIGRWVKYEDLRDNANLARIPNPTEKDLARTAKYQRAMAQLEAA